MTQALLLIFLPIITSIFIYSFKNRHMISLLVIMQSIITYISIDLYITISKNIEFSFVLGGYTRLAGIELKMDRLSIAFSIIAIIIWWAILFYNYEQIKKDLRFGYFLFFLEGVFLGFLQANDFFTIYVFIELMTIISTILIVYKRDSYSFKAGFFYLLFNSIGMIFYLIGVSIIYKSIGTLNLSLSKEMLPSMFSNSYIQLAYIFIVVSLGVKSAFFPVYNWLPKAHGAAPASISALLSGLLVKSGIYLFIKIGLVFEPSILKDFMVYIGLLTSFSGTLFAIAQKDIKQLLAFSTISQIGIMIMSASSLVGYGLVGGVYHIFSHAFAKALLFLAVGQIINKTNKRRLNEIRGVFKSAPLLSIMMLLSLFSIIGIPMFSGYMSKEIIKYSFRSLNIVYLLFSFINIGTLIYTIRFGQIFFGDGKKFKLGKNIYIALLILLIPGIILGINPWFIENIFGIDLTYFMANFNIFDLFEYALYVIVAYIIYKKFVEKEHKILFRIRHFNLSFENSVFLMIIFLFSMVTFNFII